MPGADSRTAKEVALRVCVTSYSKLGAILAVCVGTSVFISSTMHASFDNAQVEQSTRALLRLRPMAGSH